MVFLGDNDLLYCHPDFDVHHCGAGLFVETACPGLYGLYYYLQRASLHGHRYGKRTQPARFANSVYMAAQFSGDNPGRASVRLGWLRSTFLIITALLPLSLPYIHLLPKTVK